MTIPETNIVDYCNKRIKEIDNIRFGLFSEVLSKEYENLFRAKIKILKKYNLYI